MQCINLTKALHEHVVTPCFGIAIIINAYFFIFFLYRSPIFDNIDKLYRMLRSTLAFISDIIILTVTQQSNACKISSENVSLVGTREISSRSTICD